MKSKKTVEQLEEMVDSVMRWGCGEEVVAHLDWDERAWYLWFEPTSNEIDWCEQNPDLAPVLENLEKELADVGVQEFYDLDSVNAYCKRQCGSDDPYDCAEFYEDEWGNICGA